MTTPSVVVEVAFGFGPLDEPADVDFVEIASSTVKVTGVDIQRGRSSEFDDFPPSTASVSVLDQNRVLDPLNASGTHYGALLPRVPIRVRGKIGSTYYPRFRGFVDGWPMVPRVDKVAAEVQLQAADAFKLFAKTPLPASLYAAEVLSDSPRAYWKLGEATSSLAADHSGNAHDGTYINAVQGLAAVVPYGGDASMGCTGLETQGVVVTDQGCKVGATTGSWTLEVWVRANADAADSDMRGAVYRQGSAGSYGLGFNLEIWSGSYAEAFHGSSVYSEPEILFVISPASTYYLWRVPNILDGNPHHIVATTTLTASAITSHQLYVDGAAVPAWFNTTSGFVADTIPETFIGCGPVNVEERSFNGQIDEVAVYPTALSAADIVSHYTAGYSLGDGETTGARIDRILDLINWPASLRSIDDGEFLVGPAVIENRSTLDYLQSVAASEQGRLFITNDGKVAFHQRDRFITNSTENTSQFNFSDDGAGNNAYESIAFEYDERFIYNKAVLTRDGGVAITVDDLTSQATYGATARSLSGLVLMNDAQARALGDYIVFRYADPQVRAERWTLKPEQTTASWATFFGLEIGHRVTLENTPANVGSQIALALHLELIEESITPTSWQVGHFGSPVDPNAAVYFTFGGTAGQSFDNGLWR